MKFFLIFIIKNYKICTLYSPLPKFIKSTDFINLNLTTRFEGAISRTPGNRSYRLHEVCFSSSAEAHGTYGGKPKLFPRKVNRGAVSGVAHRGTN